MSDLVRTSQLNYVFGGLSENVTSNATIALICSAVFPFQD